MATKKTIELEVNTNAKDVQKQFDGFRKSIIETEQQLDKLIGTEKENSKEADNLRKKLADLNVQYDELSKTNTDLGASFEFLNGEIKPLTAQMGEMEDRLYQMALAGDTASKEYNDLLTEVGRYRKVQIDTDMVVDAAATTMSQKLGGAIQGAASGFALVQGSMALFGTESEALEETLLKVQSAMAITQGLEGLREGAKSFKAMGMAAKGAFNSIKVGMAATGIGLLVVAVGAIAAYWDDIVGALDSSQGKVDALNKEYEQGEVILKNQKAQMDIQLQIMEAEGATEEEIHKIKLAQLDTEIKHAKLRVKIAEQQKKADVEQAKRQNKILKLAINVITAPINAIIKGYNAVATTLGFSGIDTIGATVANYFIDIDKIAAEGQASINQANQDLKLLESQRQLLQVKFNKQQKINKKNRRIEAKEQAAEDLKLAKEAAAKQLLLQREIFDKQFELRKESRKKDLDFAQAMYRRELENLKLRLEEEEINQTQHDNLARFALTKLRQDILNINATYDKIEFDKQDEQFKLLDELNSTKEEKEIASLVESYEAKFELAEGNAELELALEQKLTEDLKAINDKFRKEEEDANKASNDKKVKEYAQAWDLRFSVANDSLRAINDVVQAFAGESEGQQKRAFNVNKAVGIAQAVVSTAQGIMAQLAVPQDALTGMNFVKAGIVAATGAAQIATIAKSKFQSSSSGGGDTPSVDSSAGGGMPQPSFNVVGDSGINQLAELQMQPTQAFVVSGDITTAQSLDRNKIQNATI